MNQYKADTQIISGPGAISQLKTFGIKRLLVVTDPFFYENGTAAQVAQKAQAQQVEYFSNIKPDPTVELAAEGTALVRSFQPDAVVALGGGSAMDCAKAMVYFSGSDAKFLAIPTTSGSGSEVTDFAILTHNGVKHPLVDSRLRPDAAILDSDLLQKLPKTLIADGGFDVLSHALEAFVGRDAGMITDALASAAFSVVYGLLPASYGGDASIRQKIHTAATMAGMAFNGAGLGLCHAMSHALGGAFHVPHGRLNAILLPSVIACNAHAVGEKYQKIATAAGIGGSAQTIGVRNLKNALVRLRRELDMPDTLAQAGISPAQVRSNSAALVQAVLADPCCATNPIRVEDFMVRRILDEVTGRV